MLGFSAISEAPISTLAGGLIIVDATGQQVNISLGDIDVVSSVLLTGQQLNTSVGSFIPSTSHFLNIAGQQVDTTIGTYTISAGGAITVVVPELLNISPYYICFNGWNYWNNRSRSNCRIKFCYTRYI